LYILDKHQQPVPLGVPGELYIGGAGLARGYLNRPELTAAKFIIWKESGGRDVACNVLTESEFGREEFVGANGYSSLQKLEGKRLYKTGDLARYLSDGNIEYLGRIDNQVKIRGFRIELGEIEAVLNQHPAIQQSVVIMREDREGDRRLVAYFVSSIDETSNSNNNFGKTATNLPEKTLSDSLHSELRLFLAEKLPEYMIPIFVPLKKLPLTANGKVDRRSLPKPESVQSRSKAKFVAARTPEEKLLADIYAEVLKIPQVSIYDNFFELGGHSLTAMQLVSKISTAMNVSLSLQSLLSHPTIAELTDSITELLQNQKDTHTNEFPKILNQANQELINHKKSEFLEVEHRSLLSLLSVGKIPPVDSASLGCIDASYLATSGLSRDYVVENFFENLPFLRSVRETNCGRIAGIIIPELSSELYSNQDVLVSKIIEALEMAGRIGAKCVSLTGLIPSATDYGRAITKAIANRQDLPKITTGHGTTGAAVILTIKKVCEESGRNLSGEKVGFLGLGSVGTNVLSLMLKCLPHPQEITLCDIYSKLDLLENIKQELVEIFGFKGKINLALSTTVVPPEIYNSTLIVGATNVPNVLDIIQVKSGTIIIDDSAPHCFDPDLAIQRFEEHGDILFSEGGVLRSPVPINSLIYFPPHIANLMSNDQRETTLNPNPFNIMGCAFSSLLSSRFEQLQPTVGFVDGQHSHSHYQVLQELGFEAGDLHCGEYVLPKTSIANFRHHFGKDLGKQ
ncbi:MAG: AMP-binding protein, partial [Okeania sp. SIO2G4]|uniref:phosphopantetheine-binding protein n=1 Tax=unclassified Okeania TaxID=2634635 RepID=UPI0013BBF822